MKGNSMKSTPTTRGSSASSSLSRSDRCMRRMFELRPDHCDVTLITEDGYHIEGHKVVLSSALPYFSAMFTPRSGLSYIESEQREILIKNIDGSALEEIIRWCYSLPVEPDETNVQQLLAGAKMLDCPEIVSICSDFIISQLHPENALGIYSFSDLLGCSDLNQCTLNYILHNFTSIIEKSDEFTQLTPERLIEIISSEHIDTGTGGEEVVFSSVMNWVSYDEENRKQFLPQLLEHVRFPKLAQQTLLQIEDQYPIIKSYPTCKDLLIEAMKYHLSKGTIVSSSARFRNRSPVIKPKCLLVIGGQSPKAVKHCEFYDFTTERWYDLPNGLPTRTCRAGLAILNSHIYIVGGFNGTTRLKTVQYFIPSKGQWVACPDMQARRSTLGVGVLDDKIYAVGGFDGTSGLKSAEVYDPYKCTWSYIASMSTKRSSVGVATLNNHIYAVGGYDGASRSCLSSVEYYDMTRDSWHLLPEMSQRRSGACVSVLDGKLYAIGGHDGPAVRKSVEFYDPVANCWMQCADMIVARRNAGVVTKDGLLYVIGGDEGFDNIASVEIYDPRKNQWTMLPQEMSIKRSYSSVGIIDKFKPLDDDVLVSVASGDAVEQGTSHIDSRELHESRST
ncbi:kelch-like protein 3 isoform X1 [Tetranychus urticae]|uniref:kelch-like protein 3 isoform X1 n=1 Tax=Tetranychus urticae TaxID=32264 RepID=UPI00077B959C|nr:kelch-like protein 3 isoform X1 [Tetranychus urticae]